MPTITIQEAVNQIKTLLEDAIREDGEAGKLAIIRSQKPINKIHEAVKSSLIENGVPQDQIHPRLNVSRGEIKVAGFLKRKSQDVSVFPSRIFPNPEIIEVGLLDGHEDRFGTNFTERILTVNVRSQLSSLAKNFDTLYERTFAEALNLHMRCPSMCLGEVYMIPVYEYDTIAAQDHRIAFSQSINNLEKYLMAFNAIADRNSVTQDHYKYEKVCLLVVDFNKEVPKIYSSDEELRADSLIPEDATASINNLTFDDFTSSLLDIYNTRFPGIL